MVIETRYHCPTDTRGARVSAHDAEGHRISIPYPHELTGSDVHRAAAEALLDKLGKPSQRELVGGTTKAGYAFFVPEVQR